MSSGQTYPKSIINKHLKVVFIIIILKQQNSLWTLLPSSFLCSSLEISFSKFKQQNALFVYVQFRTCETLDQERVHAYSRKM